MTPVRLKPATLRSRVKHSTTEPLRSPHHGEYTILQDEILTVFEVIEFANTSSTNASIQNFPPLYRSSEGIAIPNKLQLYIPSQLLDFLSEILIHL